MWKIRALVSACYVQDRRARSYMFRSHINQLQNNVVVIRQRISNSIQVINWILVITKELHPVGWKALCYNMTFILLLFILSLCKNAFFWHMFRPYGSAKPSDKFRCSTIKYEMAYRMLSVHLDRLRSLGTKRSNLFSLIGFFCHLLIWFIFSRQNGTCAVPVQNRSIT